MAGKVSTRELGLILGTRLLKTRDLHYGLWSDGLEVRVSNLPEAQRRYSEHMIAHIPGGTRTILDVGCGTGGLAEQLIGRGFQVTCISPSPELTRMARERLGPDVPIHETTFEAFATDLRFDVVMFSESFQYIPLRESLPRAVGLVQPGGHVLVSDFFRTDAPGESALRGGHDLRKFYEALAEQPLDILSDEDITEQTAPNLDLVDAVITDYARPLYDACGYYLRHNRPWLYKLGRWLLRRRLERIAFKYFSHSRSAAAFRTHKNYRTLLLRRRD